MITITKKFAIRAIDPREYDPSDHLSRGSWGAVNIWEGQSASWLSGLISSKFGFKVARYRRRVSE